MGQFSVLIAVLGRSDESTEKKTAYLVMLEPLFAHGRENSQRVGNVQSIVFGTTDVLVPDGRVWG